MKHQQESDKFAQLRSRAQERLSGSGHGDTECVSDTDALALLHELQVHQIELEVQNNELRMAQNELEERVEERTQELQKSEEKYRTLFESMSEGFALHEIICDRSGKPTDYRFLDANLAFERLTGLNRAEIINRTVLEVMPGTELRWIEIYGHVALSGEPTMFEEYSGVLDKYFEVYTYSPAPRQFATLFVDVTQRKLAQAQQQAFYRRTILAATQGKLAIMEPDEVRQLAGSTLKHWEVRSLDDMRSFQEYSIEIAKSMRMDQLGVFKMMTCILEGGTNILKHAGIGTASLHNIEDGLIILLEDKGPGIGVMSIPDVALRQGYTTAGTLGMGYKLMIASCRKVYLATGPGGTIVAFEVPFHNDDLDMHPNINNWC